MDSFDILLEAILSPSGSALPEYNTMEGIFFKTNKTPTWSDNNSIDPLVTVKTAKSGLQSFMVSYPNDKWPKQVLVLNTQVSAGFKKNAATFIKKYSTLLKGALSMYISTKDAWMTAVANGDTEIYTPIANEFNNKFVNQITKIKDSAGYIFGDRSLVPIDKKLTSSLEPILVEFQGTYATVVSLYIEYINIVLQRSKIFNKGALNMDHEKYAMISNINNSCMELWVIISQNIFPADYNGSQ